MKPILFSLGPFHVYSFGLSVALGALLALHLMERLARRTGFPPEKKVADLLFVTVLSGFLGARIFYVFQNPSSFLENPLSFFAFWEGGLIFYGGIPGSIMGIAIYGRLHGLGLLKSLDFLIPYTALVQAFGRIGCFLNGCCSGKACDLPWAVKFPGEAQAFHPTQLYEALYLLFVFFILSRFYPQRKFDGATFYLYLMLYGAGRFVIEFFREDNPMWQFFTVNQWMSLAIGIGAMIVYASQRQKNASSRS